MGAIEREAIFRVLSRLDGQSIFSPDVFVDAGFPAEWVSALTATHRADLASQKTTLRGAADHQQADFIRGVYGLEALYKIAEDIGADIGHVTAYDGRDRCAEQLKAAIRQKCGNEVDA